MIKILLTTLMLFTLSHAKHSFKVYDDICERTSTQECINDTIQVRNLQIALNKSLNLKLKTDGKWGENTKNAVIKFQKKYNLKPVAG